MTKAEKVEWYRVRGITAVYSGKLKRFFLTKMKWFDVNKNINLKKV